MKARRAGAVLSPYPPAASRSVRKAPTVRRVGDLPPRWPAYVTQAEATPTRDGRGAACRPRGGISRRSWPGGTHREARRRPRRDVREATVPPGPRQIHRKTVPRAAQIESHHKSVFIWDWDVTRRPHAGLSSWRSDPREWAVRRCGWPAGSRPATRCCSNSRHRVQRRRAPAGDDAVLRILQLLPDASVAEQGCARSSSERRPNSWPPRCHPTGRRASSPVRTPSGLTDCPPHTQPLMHPSLLTDTADARAGPRQRPLAFANQTSAGRIQAIRMPLYDSCPRSGIRQIEFLVGQLRTPSSFSNAELFA